MCQARACSPAFEGCWHDEVQALVEWAGTGAERLPPDVRKSSSAEIVTACSQGSRAHTIGAGDTLTLLVTLRPELLGALAPGPGTYIFRSSLSARSSFSFVGGREVPKAPSRPTDFAVTGVGLELEYALPAEALAPPSTERR